MGYPSLMNLFQDLWLQCIVMIKRSNKLSPFVPYFFTEGYALQLWVVQGRPRIFFFVYLLSPLTFLVGLYSPFSGSNFYAFAHYMLLHHMYCSCLMYRRRGNLRCSLLNGQFHFFFNLFMDVLV
jgi:hypothetical protein